MAFRKTTVLLEKFEQTCIFQAVDATVSDAGPTGIVKASCREHKDKPFVLEWVKAHKSPLDDIDKVVMSNAVIQIDRFWKQTRQYYQGQTKIGRNDPCFCGSGKKFKKCCGTN